MALPRRAADRVKDTTTTTGTGDLTLSGSAPTGYQTFNAAFSTTAQFEYCVEGGSEWEVGLGHLSASTTLVRDTVLASSNAGAAVNFSAGTKNVFCTIAAEQVDPVWTRIDKQTTESRNTTTTLTNDTDLQFAMDIGTYVIEAHIFFFAPATPDFKFAFATPTISGLWQKLQYGSSQVATTESMATTFAASISMTAGTTQFGHISLITRFNATASGTFAFQWAQDTSNASNCEVDSGSWMRYRRIS